MVAKLSNEVYDDLLLSMLSEIEVAMNNGLYMAALCLALTIPDICGNVEGGKNVKMRYIGWYDKYIGDEIKPTGVASEMPYLSGEVIFYLRSSMLHNGTPNIPHDKIKDERCQIDQFQIVVGENNYRQVSSVRYGGNPQRIIRRIYKMNLRVFCNNIIKAAREYYYLNKDKFHFDYSFNYEELRSTNIDNQLMS